MYSPNAFIRVPMEALRHHGLAISCALAVTLFPGTVKSVAGKPNFIIVLIDDLGWADFSCFGNTEAQTPHVDRLASEGLRFAQFYVSSPICSPSRTAIITGQYPQRHRITSYLDNRQLNKQRGMADWLEPESAVLPRILSGGGYATGHFGKWHMGGQRDVGDAPLITEYGFDESLTNFEGLGNRVLPLLVRPNVVSPEKYALGSDRLGRGKITWLDRDEITTAFVDAAIEFIDRASSNGQSFYVNVWPDDVHSPFFPPVERWGDGTKRSRYLAVLEEMDRQLGKLFDHVRSSSKLRDNTIILLCSDNGPEPGAGSAGEFRGHKACLYEGGIRSPLIIWSPEIVNRAVTGKWNRESVLSAMDLAPSLLELAGFPTKEKVNSDGQSLTDVLLGSSTSSRASPLFFRRPPDRDRSCGSNDAPDLAMRKGNWKLLCEYDGSIPELYDLSADVREATNLAEHRPEVVAGLLPSLLAWHASMPRDNGASYVAPQRPAAKPRKRSRP